MAGDELGLLGLVGVAHFLGVAAGGLGGLELLVLHGDEFRAQRGHLFLGGGAHVGGGHHRAEPAGGGDGLQPGDAGAHDEGLRRGDRARRGHHHGEGAAIELGRLDHGAIAGEVGLAGQRVHGLGAGDARGELHGERVDLRGRAGLGELQVAVGLEQADHDRAVLELFKRRLVRPAHAEQRVRVLQRRGARGELGSGLFIGGVGKVRPGARLLLDDDFGAGLHQRLHGVRRGRDTVFTLTGLGENGDKHRWISPRRAVSFTTNMAESTRKAKEESERRRVSPRRRAREGAGVSRSGRSGSRRSGRSRRAPQGWSSRARPAW